MSEKLRTSVELTSPLGVPTQIYEWEQYVRLEFESGASVRIYFHTNGTIDEIHTVDCDMEHDKVSHKFFSVKKYVG